MAVQSNKYKNQLFTTSLNSILASFQIMRAPNNAKKELPSRSLGPTAAGPAHSKWLTPWERQKSYLTNPRPVGPFQPLLKLTPPVQPDISTHIYPRSRRPKDSGKPTAIQRNQKREREKKKTSNQEVLQFAAMAAKGETEPNQNLRHQEVGHKSLLQSDALYQVLIPCDLLFWNVRFVPHIAHLKPPKFD